VGSYLTDTLQRKLVFFTGKGGVGKSSLCFATALAAKKTGKRVLVASWEPYDSLSGENRYNPLDRLAISRLPLETLQCFKEYALLTLKFEKVYDAVFDNPVLKAFIRTTPGVSDGVIAGKLWDVAQKDDYDLILVDLPASGHAVTFFKSPLGIKKVFSLGAIHRQTQEIIRYFESNSTRVDLVSLAEELPMTESRALLKQLKTTLSLNFGFFHLNQITPHFDLTTGGELPRELRPLQTLYEDRWEREKAYTEQAKDLIPKVLLHTTITDPDPVRFIEALAERLLEA
jgi:hypothetical protein